MGKKVAFVIHNMVLFYTIKNLYDELVKNGFKVAIYVANNVPDPDWLLMADETYLAISNIATVYKAPEYNEEEYDVVFYPYLPYQFEVKGRYNIRYQYGIAKPVWNFKAETILFDYCLCYGNYDYQFLKHYCKTEIIGNLKYAHLSESIINKINKYDINNISVLYLPTYGAESSFDDLISQMLILPSNWKIVIKLHHGTEFLEGERLKQLSGISNISIYGQNDLLEELLLKSDVVISDGSSACFDAIYFNKPLIVSGEFFGDDFFGEEPITKQLFTNYGIVKYNPRDGNLEFCIRNVVKNEGYITHISSLRDYFFPIRGPETLSKAIELVSLLLQSSDEAAYLITKLALKKYFNAQRLNELNFQQQIDEMQLKLLLSKNQINELNEHLLAREQQLNLIYSSKGWRIIQIFRKMTKMFRKTNNAVY